VEVNAPTVTPGAHNQGEKEISDQIEKNLDGRGQKEKKEKVGVQEKGAG